MASLRADLGLDQPLWAQFAIFMGDVVEGQLGTSMVYRRPVLEVVLERLPATAFLTLYAVVLSLLICVPLAVTSALRANGVVDQVIRSITTLASGHADVLAWPQSPDRLRGVHSDVSGRRIWCDALASGSGISSCRR